MSRTANLKAPSLTTGTCRLDDDQIYRASSKISCLFNSRFHISSIHVNRSLLSRCATTYFIFGVASRTLSRHFCTSSLCVTWSLYGTTTSAQWVCFMPGHHTSLLALALVIFPSFTKCMWPPLPCTATWFAPVLFFLFCSLCARPLHSLN